MKRIYGGNNVVAMLFCVLMIMLGCDSGNRKANLNNHKKPQQSVPTKQVETTEEAKLLSFVLSCGSGCAMTYTPGSVTGKLPVLIVQLKVDMFVDEKLTDAYNEVYEFSYNSSKQIERVNMQGKNDNVLETLMPDAQKSFKEFAEKLATNYNTSANEKADNAAKTAEVADNLKTFSSLEVWRWRSDDKSQEFTVKIIRLTNDSLTAQYSAVHNNGQELDCDFDTNINIKAAFNVGEKAYIGKFKSFFNFEYGTCCLRRTDNSLTWAILNALEGEYYAPNQCALVKVPEQKRMQGKQLNR